MQRTKPHCTRDELLQIIEAAGLNDSIVNSALAQAERTHRYKTRDDGKSYLTQHIYPLVVAVHNFYKGKPELRAAVITTLLHDVPEDDPTFKEDRLIAGYGKEIAELVMNLQKPKKTKQIRYQSDKHEEHIEFVARIESAPRICKIIKIFDRLNNLKCTDATRNVQKYNRFLQDTIELYLPFAKSIEITLAAEMESEVARLIQELHT